MAAEAALKIGKMRGNDATGCVRRVVWHVTLNSSGCGANGGEDPLREEKVVRTRRYLNLTSCNAQSTRESLSLVNCSAGADVYFEVADAMQLENALALALAAGVRGAAAAPLVSAAGQIAAIPGWDLQSTAKAASNLTTLSLPSGVDTSSWHHIDRPFCTLMGCLLNAGVYNDTDLFYSDNLKKVDAAQFSVPWVYRAEFDLEEKKEETGSYGRHLFLVTHGITSRADIYLNGHQIADKSQQAGAYAGYRYDITDIAAASAGATKNALAIRVHPTSYYYDFALGWVDWNPWPADNGTGVWRAVEVKQTGAVVLEPLRVVTNLSSQLATVSLRARARNLEKTAVTVTAAGLVAPAAGTGTGAGGNPITWSKTVTIPPLSDTDIVLETTVDKPAIWWPKQWGDQPLYDANLTVSVAADGALSDFADARFGFRTVSSALNAAKDTVFSVNGRPFQVLGGGYAPDMFLRFDVGRLETELRYLLDLGLNTVRLEGKNEHPALYALADRLGVMVMAGWECCDKWEAFSYNQDLAVPTPLWTDADYAIAGASMRHEAAMMQTHPSLLAYLVGSDYWPDERATAAYTDALQAADWRAPVIISASARGAESVLGPSGLRMEGPYDWVPPSYWWDNDEALYGTAAGFGSELSAGAGTPDLPSLRRFLSAADLEDLWRRPNKDLFHMSRETSTFHNRAIYNRGLFGRYGAPTSLDDYVLKAQMADYEATRAQFEAYAAMWSAPSRPATGMIYWMLTGAFPSLHWNLWDYYLRPSGGYFGAKTAAGRAEHVAYDYVRRAVHLINRSLDRTGPRRIDVQVVDAAGALVYNTTVQVTTAPNTSKQAATLSADVFAKAEGVMFVKLVLTDERGDVLSRNAYWVARDLDVLDWDNSDWYYTPVSKYSDLTALSKMVPANVSATAASDGKARTTVVTLENKSRVPAVFISVSLVDAAGREVLPLTWSDNYVTLWPGETLNLTAMALEGAAAPAAVQIMGRNVARVDSKL